MTKIITGTQMQELDRRTIGEARIPARVLMDRAGSGLVAALEQAFGSTQGKRVIILCGKGNNGGDGFVAARLLHRRGTQVQVLMMSPASELSRDAAVMYRQFVRTAGKSAVHLYTSKSLVSSLLRESDLIIDALLGTGLSSDVTAHYADAIDCINEAGRPVVAADLPSGLHADTGAILGRAVRASLTVTFGLPKLGLYQSHGVDLAGSVSLIDIGIPH